MFSQNTSWCSFLKNVNEPIGMKQNDKKLKRFKNEREAKIVGVSDYLWYTGLLRILAFLLSSFLLVFFP